MGGGNYQLISTKNQECMINLDQQFEADAGDVFINVQMVMCTDLNCKNLFAEREWVIFHSQQ